MRITEQQLTLAEQWAASENIPGRDWMPRSGGDFVQALVDEVRAARATVRHREEWSEAEDGVVLWWRFPIAEPPYAGTPLDDDFPDDVTHWTALVIPDVRPAR